MTSIAQLDELKAYLDKTGVADDELLQAILDGVSQRVEQYTGRKFTPTPDLAVDGSDTLPEVDKIVYLRVRRRDYFNLSQSRTIPIPDAREILTVTGTMATITGFQPLGDPPYRRIQVFGLSFTEQNPVTALPTLTINGRFGIWPPPADLKDAVLTMAARRWRERDAAYGDSVQLPEGGLISFFRQFPPSVQATLDSYKRTTMLR